jgi:hypothetical protein
MSQQPPPPPPPHGDGSSNGAKPGVKYDVFVIPDTGSGFLYLPSLQPNINSFVAGFACALALVVLGQSLAPAFRLWWHSMQGMGNMGVLLLLVAVGLGAWSLGRQNQDGSGGPGAGGSAAGSNGARTNAGPAPNDGPHPQPQSPPHTEMPGGPKTGTSWGQSRPAGATAGGGTRNTTGAESTPKNAWEKAREETRKREEERKAKEAEDKRREDAARRLRELREKEAREREQREKEMKERETKKKEAETAAGKGSTYAYSSVGERTSPWPSGGRPTATATAAAAAAASTTQSEASPSRPRAGQSQPHPDTSASAAPRSTPARPPAPTAKTYLGTEEETYSFRPYDKPAAAKKPRKNSFSEEGSEWSWAPSQSTARTTPPPSARAPYTTKDPDKIVIKAVYSFVNQFTKTPASQLISGTGAVTDGLILRITTEGLFIDDDVRGVAQREWDVKAWTLKLVEVWCPQYGAIASSAGANASASATNPGATGSTSFFSKATGGSGTRGGSSGRGGAIKPLTGDEADAYLADMLRACKDSCRLRLGSSPSLRSAASSSDSGYSSASRSSYYSESNSTKTGEWKAKALHLLRATIRDQEGKRYLFVISEEESWKVAVGIQRLRRGTQVRALGVAGLSGLETKSTLEMLGWGR